MHCSLRFDLRSVSPTPSPVSDVNTSLTLSARTWCTFSECIELQLPNGNWAVVDIVIENPNGGFSDSSADSIVFALVRKDSLDARLSLNAAFWKDDGR